MDRERLFAHLEQHYYPKRDILNRIPLGVPLENFWQELLNRRKSHSTTLPLYHPTGEPYWYVITEKMVEASERIIEEMMTQEGSFDPFRVSGSVSTLEEIFYTSYVEGAMYSMQDAMTFLQGDEEPRDIHEQMILNNRQASNFAASNLQNPLDEQFICALAFILTERMDNGGDSYRSSDDHEIPFLKNEHYTIPPASMIHDKMMDLIRFLHDQTVHPLIKAGVAQAWILLVRPFEEGNERLARLLSSVLLLQYGYSFFGDVSLSAIIARQTYEYYNATANILRSENGHDLTYFLEYFLGLLVRALDERKIRMAQRAAREQAEERKMAMTPLSLEQEKEENWEATGNKPSDSGINQLREETLQDLDEAVFAAQPEQAALREMDHAGDHAPQNNSHSDDPPNTQIVFEEISNRSHLMPPVVARLREYLVLGKITFTRNELLFGLGYSTKQIETVFTILKEHQLIVTYHREQKYMVYTFHEKYIENIPEISYTESMIHTLRSMTESANSPKDRRIGGILMEKLQMGIIRLDDYQKRGWQTRWTTDMLLAGQMGLVEKITHDEYMICSAPKEDYELLLPAQKAMATAMFKEFGEETFSLDMVVATLDYSSSHVSAVLHQFTLLKIVHCTRDEVNRYQFLITPQEHPECFAA